MSPCFFCLGGWFDDSESFETGILSGICRYVLFKKRYQFGIEYGINEYSGEVEHPGR